MYYPDIEGRFNLKAICVLKWQYYCVYLLVVDGHPIHRSEDSGYISIGARIVVCHTMLYVTSCVDIVC